MGNSSQGFRKIPPASGSSLARPAMKQHPRESMSANSRGTQTGSTVGFLGREFCTSMAQAKNSQLLVLGACGIGRSGNCGVSLQVRNFHVFGVTCTSYSAMLN